MKCPICQTKTKDDDLRSCGTCGWKFERYFGVGEAEKAAYAERVAIARKNWRELQELRALKREREERPPPTPEPSPPPRREPEPPPRPAPAPSRQPSGGGGGRWFNIGALAMGLAIFIGFQLFSPKDETPSGISSGRNVIQNPKAGEIMDGPLGMKFAWIPAGTFLMGSPENEPGRDDNEKQHRVTLTEGYWLQTMEVTQGQWKAVMGGNPSHFDECGENCPVESVSWKDTQEFIEKLNTRHDGEYRLPTEAQWEYAARAGTETAFYTGPIKSTAGKDPNLDKAGWFDQNSGGRTQPAGQKQRNAWGLHDMHGNVWEWCADWYGHYSSGSVTDPTGPESGSRRVLRGGSWISYARSCRSAYRDYYTPSSRHGSVGFRLALPPGR